MLGAIRMGDKMSAKAKHIVLHKANGSDAYPDR